MTTATAATAPTDPATFAADSSLREQLEPARRALLADADDEAERIVSEASRTAADIIGTAERECETQLDQVRRRRDRSTEAYVEQMLTTARSDAHEAVLRAREASRRRLIDAIHQSVMALPDDPRYGALLDHLEELARRQLGVDAVIDRDPRPGGGIIAVSGSRRVDYTLPALADRALEGLADKIVQLWE